MKLLVFGFCWVVVHFLAYAFLLRFTQAFGRERNIFAYHMSSFLTLGCGSIIAGLLIGLAQAGDAIITVLSLHGIYSMSFLSLWASAEGGFSLNIMKEVGKKPFARSELIDLFVKIGDHKRRDRLGNLGRMGFIRKNGTHFEIAPKGRKIAHILRILHFINNYGQTG